MKRFISYATSDGKVFDNRLAAMEHETKLKVRERLSRFFGEKLSDDKRSSVSESLGAIIECMSDNAQDCTDALSFRAARRQLHERGVEAANAALARVRSKRRTKTQNAIEARHRKAS